MVSQQSPKLLFTVRVRAPLLRILASNIFFLQARILYTRCGNRTSAIIIFVEYITEISSDSKISSFSINQKRLRIEFKLYTEQRITLEFEEFEAIELSTQWIKDIEGIQINESSSLLDKTKAQLIKDLERIDHLKSYKILSSTDEVLGEFIASGYSVI